MSKANIYNRLMDAIGNPYGVCGLMGNIQAESGMVSTNAQNSCMARLGMTDASYTAAVDNGTYTTFATDRIGYGLCQWTSSGRKAGLLDYAKLTCRSIGNEDMQIEWLLHELSTSYKNVMKVLQSATSVKEASDIVVTKFERPANQSASNLAKRQAKGEALYRELVKEDIKVSSKIIAIDAGHGMKTAGKRCLKSIDPNQTREWYLNDRIADRLQELLAGYDCTIIRVDDTTGARDIPLSTRVKTANSAKADVYVSIHHNAGIGGRTGGGTAVYYYSSAKERRIQAQDLYNEVVTRTGLTGNRSCPVLYKGFYVIKHTSMPALLIENGFMDSVMDTPIILTASHAEKTAQGILAFLVDEYRLTKNNGSTSPEKPQTGIYYPAYTGKKTTLAAAMTSLGINSTYSFRKQVAKANGITGYIGTAAQNTQMYNLLVAGLLKKV